MKPIPIFTLFVLLALVTSARAQESVDNPEYTSWAKCPKGTIVTLKKLSSLGVSTTVEDVTTHILIEVAADKVVIDSVTVTKLNGREITNPQVRREIARAVAVPMGVKPEDVGRRPPKTFEDGAETLRVGDATHAVKWYKSKHIHDGVEYVTKRWIADDVPGLIVKEEWSAKGSLGQPETARTELVGVKKP